MVCIRNAPRKCGLNLSFYNGKRGGNVICDKSHHMFADFAKEGGISPVFSLPFPPFFIFFNAFCGVEKFACDFFAF